MIDDTSYLQYLSKNEVVKDLWDEYTKTPDYLIEGKVNGISENHPIVRLRLEKGLKDIYGGFVYKLTSQQSSLEMMRERTIGEWLEEWKKMHSTLFKNVLKERGDWRKIDITFGLLGDDENLYKIPHHQEVPREIQVLSYDLKNKLSTLPNSLDEGCKSLAQIHYQFIRIHPFQDGNGRIARAITDQISICFKYTAAMSGYPRHSKVQRISYHESIRDCALGGQECSKLTFWIKEYIETVAERIIG